MIAAEPVARVLNYVVDPINSLVALRKRSKTPVG